MDSGKLKVGVLGCGPIAQAAHFESCTKAHNAELYAICDSAVDILGRMESMWAPKKAYTYYQAMLDDPEVDAVIIAAADAFHVALAKQAVLAGKHVLCEKPLGVVIEEVVELRDLVEKGTSIFQVAHMKRFDDGIQAAHDFVKIGMGEMAAYKGWYCDNTHRYVVTDAVQPKIVASADRRRPSTDPKADKEQYYLLAHGSHLVDLAYFLVGNIEAVEARHLFRGGVHTWFVDVFFANGTLGHLDLTVGVRMDWHEGFQIYGENGSVMAKTYNPWYFKSSDVDIFDERSEAWTRPLAADGHFYRRQLESFADTIRNGSTMRGATIQEGLEVVKTLVAIRQSTKTGKRVLVADAKGSV
jgi:Predicted dehydrogenases and related proteins